MRIYPESNAGLTCSASVQCALTMRNTTASQAQPAADRFVTSRSPCLTGRAPTPTDSAAGSTRARCAVICTVTNILYPSAAQLFSRCPE